MWRIFAVLFTLFSLQMSAFGWHSNAWDTVRGVDRSAYTDMQGVYTQDTYTQTTSPPNPIPCITLTAWPVYEHRVSLPATTNSTRSFTYSYYSDLGRQMYTSSYYAPDEYQVWTNEVTRTNTEDEAYTVTTVLERSNTVYLATNDASRVPIDTTTYRAIRELDIYDALRERFGFVSGVSDYNIRWYNELFFYHRDWRGNLGELKEMTWKHRDNDLYSSFIIPMDDYTDWWSTKSEYEWEDTNDDGDSDTWVPAYPDDWPRWDELSLCRSNNLPVECIATNTVTNTVSGYVAGQYNEYEVEDYVHDEYEYETYIDKYPLRDLFMVSNSYKRVEDTEVRVNPFEIANAAELGKYHTYENDWEESSDGQLLVNSAFRYDSYQDDEERDYGYKLTANGSTTTLETAQFQVYHSLDNTNDITDGIELYDHTFTSNEWVTISLSVTNTALPSGYDMEDYDIRGMKKILDDLYIIETSMNTATSNFRYVESGDKVPGVTNTWERAKNIAEGEFNDPFPGESYESQSCPLHYFSVWTKGGKSMYGYDADIRKCGAKAGWSNDEGLDGTLEYYIIVQKVDEDSTLNAEQDGFTERATKMDTGTVETNDDEWVSDEWIGDENAEVPDWCDDPTGTNRTQEGYEIKIESIMRLGTNTLHLEKN